MGNYRRVGEIDSNLWPDIYIFSRFAEHERILDMGCATGKLAIYLSRRGHDVFGADMSFDAIKKAQARDREDPPERCGWVNSSAAWLPFVAKTFDVIILEAVLTLVPRPPDRQRIMNEASRVIKPGGLLYISDFAQNWQIPLYRKRYTEDFGITGEQGLFVVRNGDGTEKFRAKHYSRREMVELVIKGGFEIESLRTVPVRTMTGNKIDGYQVIARKS